jgi:hypothetical protein
MSKRSSSGGIADSGIFGLIGTTVQCDSEDQSTYCKFARIINIIVWILMLVALFYVAKKFLLKNK